MVDFAWFQFGLLGWGAVALFLEGARQKGIPITAATAWQVVQAACIVVLLFALLTEGRGCAYGNGTATDICAGDDGC